MNRKTTKVKGKNKIKIEVSVLSSMFKYWIPNHVCNFQSAFNFSPQIFFFLFFAVARTYTIKKNPPYTTQKSIVWNPYKFKLFLLVLVCVCLLVSCSGILWKPLLSVFIISLEAFGDFVFFCVYVCYSSFTFLLQLTL